MPKASPIQTNFTAGEWSPKLDGRVDLSKYFNALKECRNFLPTVQGPAGRRQGTRHVAAVKTAGNRTALIPFEFSVTQAYMIEVGDRYFRFYRDNGRIESGGSPVELTTPYTQADLFDSDGRLRLKFAQSADTLYLCHPSYSPRKLTRSSHTSWTIQEIEFLDGPYLVTNTTATTITPSAATGVITLTASASIFAMTDEGRAVRLKVGSDDWGWALIDSYVSGTVVSATVISTLTSAAATDVWRLGLWSGTTGYPAAVTFFEERLTFGGPTDNPQRLDMSRTGDFENFAPSDFDGTVVGDHAVGVVLAADNVNAIRWLANDEKGLLVGTVGGEWLVTPSTLGESITPDNVSAKRSSNFGSADMTAVRVGRATYYVQRSGKSLRELAYVFEDDGFRSPEMTLLAEHISGDGIVSMAYQQEPSKVLWCARVDGALLGLTLERVQDVVGWSRNFVGGYSDSGQSSPAVVESVAVIPGSGRDELWMIVRRYIDGGTVRYVEYLDESWDDGDQEDAFFVDSGLSYDSTPATVFSGLGHLEGQTVSILADGAVLPNDVVASSQITLENEASVVHIGLAYTSRIQTMRLEAGAADGTAQGKIKRITRMVGRFYRSLGAFAGPDISNLDEIPELRYREPSTPMGDPEDLFTGDAELAWPSLYEREGYMVIQTSQPLPCTIIALMPQVTTQDR